MRSLRFFLLMLCGLLACNPPADNTTLLQSQINELEKKLADTYKPGFGEFMSRIQVHHNKLFFAGKAQNWDLADFEIREIQESLQALPKYCADREEVKSLSMLDAALDSMSFAIRQKKPGLFNSSYNLLTNTCNNCHRETHFEFNLVKIPDAPPYSNQEFKVIQ